MGHWIELQTPGGSVSAWRANPPNLPCGALVVIQEIFGVNSHIRAVVDKFASLGYCAIAPGLFDYCERHVELGYDSDGVAYGLELARRVGLDRAVDAVASAAEVSSAAKVGVVGYCWGGTVAYLACARLGLPAVSYYGGRTVPFLQERPAAPLLLHFGENDPVIPPADIERHHEALPDAELHIWPAGHGFNCDQRADFNATVAVQAMQRTLAFFTGNLS